ncbi:MAG TPA: hypothetical protein VNB90_11950 [Cytophagaceae bacterium]|nr:hypothetical protein [Cytophagaceae bacterium]
MEKSSYLIKYLKIVLTYAIVILLGFTVFFLDDREVSNVFQGKVTVVIISIIKSIYFMIFNYKKIVEVSKKDLPYYEFLLFIGINVFLIIFSFAIDYSCLYWIEPTSFSNIPAGLSYPRIFFEFSYLSILSYTNFGYAEILAVSGYAKLLVIFEDVIAYSMTIFILADFVSLKESIRKRITLQSKKGKSADL